MQLLNPWFLLLSFFLAAVVLFYFFRKRYEEQKISSNMLWVEVRNEWQASPFLKKLQKNLLFWLQIFALLFLMLALARPYWVTEDLKGDHVIFIIDTSATMSAEYEESTRFDEAKKAISALLDKVSGQKVTLIQTGERPEILISGESDKALLKKKLEAVQLTYNYDAIGKALELAYSLASGDNSAIYIFSDSVTKDDLARAPKNQYIEVHNIGTEVNNLSLLSFGAAKYNGEISGVAVIENQSTKEVTTEFLIQSTGGKPLFKKNLTISGRGQLVVEIPSLPEKPYYEAVILADDGYETDNRLTSVLMESNPPVYALGNLNPFLIKGFQTIGTEVFQVDAGSAVEGRKGIFLLETADMDHLPSQPVILFNSGTEKIPLTVSFSGDKDALLQYVDYENIYIYQATKALKADQPLQTVLRSGSVPLIEKGIYNGQPIIIVNFSLSDSDWPLKPSFPIFLYNAYQWLSQPPHFQGFFEPGEEKWLNAGGKSLSWAIYNDRDEHLYTVNPETENFRAPQKPGVYQAVAGETIYYFSVILDDREKSPVTEKAFTVNKFQENINKKDIIYHDQIWFWLSLLALALIAAEWEVFRRGYRI